MKTNTMMRVASVLLVAVLLSTCAIAGTYAKYTTSQTGSDSARVAKWGVNINAGGAMFATSEAGSTVTKTVLSSDTDNVVAPGMTGNMAAIEISGSPEVAVKVTHVATVTVEGWIINTDEFYCPIVVTVDFTVRKVWNDGSNENGERPDSVTRRRKVSVSPSERAFA